MPDRYGVYGSQGSQDDPCCPYEIDWSNLGDLCAVMPRPLLTTGILIQWLREHFSNASNIENPMLRNEVWTSNILTTGITIDSVFKWQPANTEARPGIYIKRGPWKVVPYGIDNRKMITTNNTCPQKYNVMYQGSHTIFCIAGESGEVELLAAEVYRELIQFGPVARERFNFLRFAVTDIGEPAILEEATENFVVPVVVSYGAQDVWAICPPGV